MEKLKKFDWVAFSLIMLGLRSLYDANVAQALIVACFSALVGYNRFLASKQQRDIDSETRSELERIKANMSALMVKNASKPADVGNNVRFF